MSEGYQSVDSNEVDNEVDQVRDALEALVSEGARRMLESALEEEVSTFLGRDRYQRGSEFRGYRNGYHRSREITVGLNPVQVKVPRVSQVPTEVSTDGFSSQIVHRYERVSKKTQELFRKLYLEGLATGDFEPVFRELVGETAALSANTIVRLKAKWGEDYEAWRARSLEGHTYAYIWADGMYLGVGSEEDKSALLCVLGAREDGVKELLAMELGYRESAESWADVLRGLRDRGLCAPLVAVGDGALGLWAALDQVFPETDHQRCWNHRALNVQAKVPKRLQAQVRGRIRAISNAPTLRECEELRDLYVAELRASDHQDAAETMLRDWDSFVTFYRYPKEHWVHLRTSNPLESIFSGVRIRTDATRRMKRRDSALYLVFKIVERLSQRWRSLNGGENLMSLVLEGCVFKDGILQLKDTYQMQAAAD
ncbi:MAG: IS256 family transposase [Chloroflexi bacterium]|nr:IS256 family transposase [Chloroflexota bacterium]